MEKYLQRAIHELGLGEVDNALDELDEAEYGLRGMGADDEVLELIDDARFMILRTEFDKGLMFTRFALDVLTLTEMDDYDYNEDIPDLMKEMVELKACDTPSKMSMVQHDIDIRRLDNKIMEAMISDHEKRYGVRFN